MDSYGSFLVIKYLVIFLEEYKLKKDKINQVKHSKIYLIGSGIASLASAVYLVEDALIPASDIIILEQDSVAGGACDGAEISDEEYIIRGGRMHEAHYECYWELLSRIPSYDDPNQSVMDESFKFSKKYVSNAKARLLKNGKIMDVTSFGLSIKDKIDFLKLTITPEQQLGNKKIEDWFGSNFFETNFWFLWTSMFAFQRWSSLAEMRRYMRRFIHLVDGLNRLGGVMRTKYNQYHSVIVPLQRFLEKKGVQFQMQTQVVDIDFVFNEAEIKMATAIHIKSKEGVISKIDLQKSDYVFITNGSITDSTDFGSWLSSPALKNKATSGSWCLWENIAKKNKDFGNPGVFCNQIDLQKWYSFTAILKDSTFHNHMEKFSGNVDGTGGLVTFTDSNWLMSIVIAHQPHFPHQPLNVKIFWGYGLYPDREGNFVKKKMSECSGQEVFEELLYHLKMQKLMKPIVASGKVNCIPVAMPFIDSLFMPRTFGDRPQVIPEGATNFAFLGQFAEVPDDCVFTVEYSVRTAQMAVYGHFETQKKVIPIYKSINQIGVLLRAMRAINR